MKRLIVTTALLFPLLAVAKSNPYLSQSMSYSPSSSKVVNVRIFVPGLFIGRIGGAIDFKLNNSWSIGPLVRYWTYSWSFWGVSGNYAGLNAGVTMNYALNHNLDNSGWLVNPYLEYVRDNYDDGEDKESGIETGVNFMYQWMWDIGVNIQAGVGAEYSSLDRPFSLGGSKFHPNFEITLGYAF